MRLLNLDQLYINKNVNFNCNSEQLEENCAINLAINWFVIPI